MLKWELLFKPVLVFLLIFMFFVSCASKNEKKTTDLPERYLYKIENPVLKEQLISFHEQFKDHELTQGRGLCISCRNIYEDSISYFIGYTAGFGMSEPFVFCEPIEGRPVVLIMDELYNEFSMDMVNYMELMKPAVKEQDYETYKQAFEWCPDAAPIIMYDFVSLMLTFDRKQNLLHVDTLGFY